MYPKLVKLDYDLSKTLEADYSASNSCIFHQKYEQADAYNEYGNLPKSYCEQNTTIHQVFWDLEEFDVKEIGKQLHMDIKGLSTIKQDPGNVIPMHKDIFKRIKDANDVTNEKIIRANIHITEWNPGHCIQYEKNNTWYNYQDWEVGSGLLFDDSCLHIGINAGMKPKITMQISGFYRG